MPIAAQTTKALTVSLLQTIYPDKRIESPTELGFPESKLHRVHIRSDYFLYYWQTNLIATADVFALHFNSVLCPTSSEARSAISQLFEAHSSWNLRSNMESGANFKAWYCTLAANQGGPACVEVWARSWEEARDKMFQIYDAHWAFQYESLEKVHPLDRKILQVVI
jgi:hypothetical protein